MPSIGAHLDPLLREIAEATTLGDLLVRASARSPDAEAVVFPTERATYGELLNESVAVARGLIGLGVDRGDHVGILMPNSMDFLRCLFGAALLGTVVVPINSRFRTAELRHVTGDADLKVILTSDLVAEHADHPARLAEALPGLSDASESPLLRLEDTPELRAVVSLGAGTRTGFVSRQQFEYLARDVSVDAVEQRRALVRIRDTVMLLYTSGTTANPKGCIHTHEGLVRNGIVTGRTRFHLDRYDRFWDPLPMFHVGFLLPMIAAVDAGATILTMTHLDADTALQQVASERATWLFPAFPAVANTLLDHPAFGAHDLSHVRMTMCVGTAAELRRLQEAIPSSVQISTYGSTETGGVITYHLVTDTPGQRSTTCGPPFRGIEVRVVDLSTGEELPDGEIGEICVRGYSIFSGYYNDSEKTAQALDAAGWLHTGDLGSLDDAGHVTYHGRLKDMLKVGGENVGAVEVEAVLSEHPDVAVAAVVGAPDGRLSEVVAAFVERRAGSDVSADDLIAHCAARLASFKVPQYVRFVTDWPMSATKILKHVLREQIALELSAPGGESPRPKGSSA
ncbi:MAG: AMP-binding protein [Acidimicrobiia bacterium]